MENGMTMEGYLPNKIHTFTKLTLQVKIEYLPSIDGMSSKKS